MAGVKDNKITLIGTWIWTIGAFFFLYEFLLRTIVGTFEHPIMNALHINTLTFSLISATAYQIAYGFMQVPVGIITDRFGLKRAMLLAVALCAGATFGFGMIYDVEEAFAFRVLMGLSSSFGFVCLLVIVYDWFPRKYIGLFIGLSQFVGTIGPMAAAGPVNELTQSGVSWRDIFYGLGIAGAVLAVFVLLFVRNNPDKPSEHSFVVVNPNTIAQSLKELLVSKQIWYIAIYSAFVYFAISYLSINEGITYLESLNLSSDFSSYMITIAWLGYAIGCPLLGYISDITSRRKPVMLLAALLIVISVVLIVYFPLSKALLIVAFFMLGVGASGQSVGFAIIADNSKSTFLAAGLGFNNGFMMMISAFASPLVSYFLQLFSKDGAFTQGDYHLSFLVLVVMGVVASILASFFIKETYCKNQCEPVVLSR
jgi:MFS family permease